MSSRDGIELVYLVYNYESTTDPGRESVRADAVHLLSELLVASHAVFYASALSNCHAVLWRDCRHTP